MSDDPSKQDKNSPEAIAVVAEKLALAATERHLFLCTGKQEAGKGCCSAEIGEAAWARLKERVNELNKQLVAKGEKASIQRTAAKCLRVCAGGPIGVVYPEGVWYRSLSGDNLERVITEHLGEGRVVEDLVISTRQDLS